MKISIEEYYVLLGIPKNSELNEIKKAYRKKAKELHPDKNKAENAQQKFIELTQAYEYLIAHLDTYFVDEVFFDENEELLRRQKAEQYARMKYEAFTKTDFYINDQAFLIILEHIQSFISLVFMTAPLTGYLLLNNKGIWIGLLVSFCTLPIWGQFFQKKNHVDFSLLLNAIKRVLKIKHVQLALGIVFNIILFFSHTLKTVLNSSFFLVSFIVFAGICLVANLFKTPTNIKYKVIYIALPFLFNYFFWINYTFSKNPTTETYAFHQKLIDSASFKPNNQHLEKSTTLLLENNQYQNQHYLRMFYDYEKMKNKNKITFHFEEGFFGLKVLKSYYFSYPATKQ